MRKLFAILVFLVICVNSYAGTIYFSTGGNDLTGNGSSGFPYASLFKACSVSVPGDIVHGVAGTYNQTALQVIVPVGVSIEGEGSWAGGTKIILNYSLAGFNGFNNSAIQLVSGAENTPGNQSISNIWFDGNNFVCFSGILIRCRSNVTITNCKFTNFAITAINLNGKLTNSTGTPPGTFATGNQVTHCSIYDSNDRPIQQANSVSCGSISYSGQTNFLFDYDTLININKAIGHNGDLLGAVQGNNKLGTFTHLILQKPADDGTSFNFGIESWYDQGGTIFANNTYTGGGNAIDIGYGGANKGILSYSWYIHDNLFTNPSLLTSNGSQPILSIAIQFESSTNITFRPQNATDGDAIIQNNYCKNMGTLVQITLNNYAPDFVNNLQIDHNVCESMGYTNSTYSGVFNFNISNGTSINNIFIDNNTIVSTASSGFSKAHLILQPNVGTIHDIYFRNNIVENALGYGYLLFRGNIACDRIFSQNNITFQNANLNNPYTLVTSFNAGSFIVGNTYRIVSVGTTDFTAIGASSNTTGTVFTATGAGSGSGIAVTEIPPTNFTNTGNFKVDPIFVSPNPPVDYHLGSGSVGINGGLNPPATYIGAYQPGTITPTITWPNPAAITYGTALSATQLNATSGGVPGTFAYNPASGTILNAGTQTLNVIFTPTDQNTYSVVSKSVTIIVNQATATLAYSNLTQTYNGLPLAPTITTNPAGLTVVSTTYNGVGSIPVNAGVYTVVSGLTNANYTATPISNTFTINKASATINISNLNQVYDGSPKGIIPSTVPFGLSGLAVTYNGSSTAPTAAGSYSVIVTLTNQNYQATDATGTLTIAKATPTVSWSNPANIVYGTALSATQLNATASVAGTFNYTPNSGTILNAGSNILSVNFTPTDAANYNSVLNTTVTITVTQASATINVSNLNQIFDGNPKPVTVTTTPSGLGVITTLYNGSATAPSAVGSYPVNVTLSNNNYTANPFNGTETISNSSANIFITNLSQVYTGSPLPVTVTTNPAGLAHTDTYNGSPTVPTNVGSYTVIATLNSPYSGADTQTLVISKANPIISWSNPSPITYGTALSGTQLNASASVAGVFTYTPASGSILNAGSQTLSTSFVPTDATNYNSIPVTTVTLIVNKAVATLTLSGLAQTYNTLTHPVTVTTSPVGLSGVTILYNGSGTPPTNAGSYPISVTLTNTNYTATPISGTLVIAKAIPNLSWVIPIQIIYPQPLTATQLNASSNVAGTFSYSPILGTVLNPGTSTLTATFTPTDTVNYSSGIISVPISVAGSSLLDFTIIHGGQIYENLPGQ